MDYAMAVMGGALGLVLGVVIPLQQHRLYRNEEHRANPVSGRRRVALQIFCAVSGAIVGYAAFRPDHYDFGPAALTFVFGIALIALSSTDFERRIIPNRLTYPAIVAAAALAWAWPDRSWEDILWGGLAGLGIAVGMVVLGFVAGFLLGSKETPFGMGDAKLILLIGLITGWPAMLTAVFIGVILAGGAAFYFLFRKGRRSVFSYGPYLAAGAIAVMLWYERLVG